MRLPKKSFTLIALAAVVGLIAAAPAFGFFEDDYAPETDARVARIRHIEGDAEVRRIDSEEWEPAVMNLPLVEGDEIRTTDRGRVEIQFDNDTYLRLDERSAMKLVSLGEEGAAVSIAQGTLLVSVFKYDPGDYFEIDAPKTTVAITAEGKYRVDAGDEIDETVKVSVWDGGTARVYTLDSGFTLKNDQSALMNLEGPYAGKWEVARSSGIRDDFDEWAAARDIDINENLKDAYYGKYYDDDLYGADDLNYYGSWQYDNDYGYLWSPYDRAVSVYDNWSPYRYGQWRWLPYYGWTWVNDEPWGWATYHHGRWIYLNGRWYWTPYSYSSYYPNRRSWWRPAIVYIGYIGNRVCWYPLPYNYSYYDYNRHYRNYWRNHRRDRNGTNNGPVTAPAPDPANVARSARNSTPPLGRIPPGGVVMATRTTFGTKQGRFDTAPPEISKEILSKKPVIADSPPILPDIKTVRVQKTPDIIPADRKGVFQDRKVRIGAGERKAGVPLDKKLLDQKVRANRPPLITMPRVNNTEDRKAEQPRTGVFDRSKTPRADVERKTIEPRRTVTPPMNRIPDVPTEKAEPVERKYPPPVYRPAPRPAERKPDPPVYRPAPRREERKPSPPVYAPPQRRVEQPRPSPPLNRQRPPAKTEQRPPSPPRTKSPPPSTNSRKESKPAPKPPVTVKKPDN